MWTFAGLLTFAGGQGASATTALVFDPHTGQVFHATQADRKWYPASLTKLMTAYVTFEVLREKRITGETWLTMTELANAQEPTKLWLHTDTRLRLSTVLGAMIVKSANDAAVMLAEGIGGELAAFTRYGACANLYTNAAIMAPHPMELFHVKTDGLGAARYDDAVHSWSRCRLAAFVHRMNATARRLAMTNTTFTNPNGLPNSRQMTTARDLALLARAIIRNFPEHAALFARKSMRYGGGRLRSYNSLLRTMKGADGMKTGFICASGYNIVASATRNGRRVVAVVLGWSRASQRNARAVALLETGFGILPSNAGPHGHYLDALPISGDPALAPPDIRNSLASRSCRRTVRPRVRVFSSANTAAKKRLRLKRVITRNRKIARRKLTRKAALKARAAKTKSRRSARAPSAIFNGGSH